MYSLNVGGINGILSFYTGITTAFTASAFSSTPMIILSIAVYLAIVVFLVLFILACAKKNAPKGFKSRAIIYALITLVVSIILLGGIFSSYTKIHAAYKNTNGSSYYGSAAFTVKVDLILLPILGALFFILGNVSSLVCILAKPETAAAVEEAKPVEQPKEEAKEEVKEPEPVKEEPKPVEEEKPIEEKKEEPVKEEPAPAPVEEKKEEPAVAAAPKKKYEKRVPFKTRLNKADPAIKAIYKELKNEMTAYGIKSRVSVTGDTYRLHTVKYLKITVAGKKLKLYYKLDPKKYDSTTIPHEDASKKKIYADTPLVFKVKSDLSLKRAKALIKDMMDEAKIEKKEPKAAK